MKHFSYRLIASLCFFTRLPFWRITNVPAEYYKQVVPLWPAAGWVTGGAMAVSYFLFRLIFPTPFSLLSALCVRTLVTGALHEDGFADFCDGFGGGNNREHILDIMKDSRVGTYGVIGLILYYLLFYNTLTDIAEIVTHADVTLPVIIFTADVMSKAVSSTLIYSLAYARTEQSAKNRLVYCESSLTDKLMTTCLSVIPCVILYALCTTLPLVTLGLSVLAACVVRSILVHHMRRRIQGYTGDCCGATFIICELSMYATTLACVHMTCN